VIVVDTNLFAYLYLPGDQTSHARRALERDSAWAAPLLWRSEFRNVLATAVRTRRMDVGAAIEAMDAAMHLMTGREYSVHSAEVLRLAEESKCSAYDCEYVALAQDLEVPLVTADRRLLRAFPKAVIALAEFGAAKRRAGSPT